MLPPKAKKVPKIRNLHNDKFVDNYFWLRDKSNPDVISYLEAENTYTKKMTAHTEEFRNKLYEEMKSRIKETDLSVPVKKDQYYYYHRTEEGKQYRIYCRKKDSMDAEEEVILDVNKLAEGKDFFMIGTYNISPNHKLLEYSSDINGSEQYTIHIKNLETRELLPDEIPNTYYSLEWGNDNKTLFYTVLDDAKRSYKLFRHTLGTDYKEDVLIHHEKDEAFFVDLLKTKSKKFILLTLHSMNTTEVHYLDADNPMGRFQIIQPRQRKIEYEVGHRGDRFYIVTNDNATNFKVMIAPIDNPSRENWKEFIPYNPAVKIDFVECFANYIVVHERQNGYKQIRIINMNNNSSHNVEFPEPVYSYFSNLYPDYNSNILRFTYSSLITPRSVFDYNMKTGSRELRKQYEVLGGYDPSLYESKRVYAAASDGKKIPISLLFKKGTTQNGKNPLLLYGYGSYGATIDPMFNSNRFSLIDRGFFIAYAHIRGGGSMGRTWYEDGKLLKKKNTFTDFIASAEYLITEKYTNSDKLTAMGGSAGGLLMGAITNMRPDLFHAVVAQVPFVDVINTISDPSLPLTVIEWDEWGNPRDKEFYKYMRSYSPYDNIEPKNYPKMLITSGLNDPRVSYWEPAKFIAKLRELKKDDNILLLKTNMGSGHAGPSGRYNYLKEIAFEYAFMLDQQGFKE